MIALSLAPWPTHRVGTRFFFTQIRFSCRTDAGQRRSIAQLPYGMKTSEAVHYVSENGVYFC